MLGSGFFYVQDKTGGARVEADTGDVRVFDKDSGADLVDAVTASCAIPGIWPPATIGSGRYIDGGTRSVVNADLAAGYQRILILAPMAARGGGAIINIASVAGLGTTSHDAPEYAVAKAGVIRFTACLEPLRASMGVRANCICPGLVDTPSSRRSQAGMSPAERAALPPALTPDDIADAALGLMADEETAGRTLVCRAGQPWRLLPLVDWQTA